ncbi:MAG: TlpA family protein disulfide reductase [Bacteroidota bacterium]|jgi:cytochrome c biogenesis protein CcmG/thiol:disulfide interchange protein DsbE
MKKLLTAITLAVAAFTAQAQSVPDVKIKNMEGATVSTNTISNDGKPMIISFWATWCKPCIKELETINEVYAEWREQTGVKLVIVSIDDTRTTSSVAPFLNAKGWEYESYLDVNSDFRRAMNVNMVPHTFLLNGKREVINQHTSFAPGDEDKLFEKVKAAAGK